MILVGKQTSLHYPRWDNKLVYMILVGEQTSLHDPRSENKLVYMILVRRIN